MFNNQIDKQKGVIEIHLFYPSQLYSKERFQALGLSKMETEQ